MDVCILVGCMTTTQQKELFHSTGGTRFQADGTGLFHPMMPWCTDPLNVGHCFAAVKRFMYYHVAAFYIHPDANFKKGPERSPYTDMTCIINYTVFYFIGCVLFPSCVCSVCSVTGEYRFYSVVQPRVIQR